MITCSLIAQGAINHDEIWRLTGGNDLTGGGNANQNVASAGEKLLRYEYSERRTYRAANNPNFAPRKIERVEFGMITWPSLKRTRLPGASEPADNIAVRIKHTDTRHVTGINPLLSARFAQQRFR